MGTLNTFILNKTKKGEIMRALVIYDSTGRIYLIMYGEETAPQGLPALFVDIPDGAELERIDVTNPDDPKPVFTYLPESDIGRLQKQVAALEGDVANLQKNNEELKAANDELTLAMAEMIGGAL